MLKNKAVKVEKTEHSTAVDYAVCLLALLFMSVFYYGYRALVVAVISVVTCYAVDMFCIYLRKGKFEFKDYSAIITGLIFALMMPASVSYGMLIIACAIMIFIGKQVFGGKENYIFQPVAVGYALVTLCWKESFLLFTNPEPLSQLSLASSIPEAQYHSLTYFLNLGNLPSLYNFDILLGTYAGPMGTTHLILLLVCAACLVFRRSASGLTILSCLGTLAAGAILFPMVPDMLVMYSIVFELMSGMTLFVLLFVVCDKKLSPKTGMGKFLYGILVALLTLVFRRYSMLEQSIVFAVIISNVLTSTMDALGILLIKLIKLFFKFIQAILIYLAIALLYLINYIYQLSRAISRLFKKIFKIKGKDNKEELNVQISSEPEVENTITEKVAVISESSAKKVRSKKTEQKENADNNNNDVNESISEVESKEEI